MTTGTMITLFEQYSSLREKLPYVQLGEFPTPILHLTQLGKEVGADRLYLKDDGVSGLEYGGNKIRKLEFILESNMRVLPNRGWPQRTLRRKPRVSNWTAPIQAKPPLLQMRLGERIKPLGWQYLAI